MSSRTGFRLWTRAERIDHRRPADVTCLACRELGRALLLPAHGIGAAFDRGAIRDRARTRHVARHPALIAEHHALLDEGLAARIAGERLLARRRRVRGTLRAEVARHHHRLRMAGDRQQHRQRGEDDGERPAPCPPRLWLLRQALSLRRNEIVRATRDNPKERPTSTRTTRSCRVSGSVDVLAGRALRGANHARIVERYDQRAVVQE